MNLEPLMKAEQVVQIHAAAAILALILGAKIFWQRKGTKQHKFSGKLWVGLMAVVALSSFFINELKTFGPFSAIHILSVVTLISLVQAVLKIRAGKVRQHKNILYSLYFGGLVGAGVFTLVPGRILNRVLFGDPDFYLTSVSDAWIMPTTFALAVGAYVYWRVKKTG